MNIKAMHKFRETYRKNISKSYNGYLHILSVFLIGLSVIFYSITMLDNVSLAEYISVPMTIIVVNFAEYASHRWLGHKKTKVAALFYSRHTGDHHSFFLANHMSYESTRDWRVILFPAYLIIAFILGLILPMGYILTSVFTDNVAYLYSASAIFGYLFYETMHFSYHLPKGSFFERFLFWKKMKNLHDLHHNRNVMTKHNFNITIPIFDWLLRTYKPN